MNRIYQHVIDTPQAEAIYDGNTRLSYEVLWGKASYLALQIDYQSDKPYIGVLLDRSTEAIIAMLAILISGKAFVPIDIENPIDRIHYIVKNAGLDCVITSAEFLALLPEEIVTIEAADTKEIAGLSCPQLNNSSNAYMIYTSGSTGMPKGVRVNHGNTAHYIEWSVSEYINKYQITQSFVHSSIAFDLTITGIFAPLASGKKVIIPKGFGAEVLIDYFSNNEKIGLVKLTPSHLRLIRNSLEKKQFKNKQGIIIVGGEALYAGDVGTLISESPQLTIINEYGPTETTVGCMVFELNKDNISDFEPESPIPIGKAINQMVIEIVDESDNVCPDYIPGEIYISGIGVTDGYLNKNELTAEKFYHAI